MEVLSTQQRSLFLTTIGTELFIRLHFQESWVNAMRSFENGTLKMEGDQQKGMPPLNKMRVPMVNAPAPHLLTKLNPERMYLLGDPRTNQNPAFLVMGILFYRWHNYQVPKTCLCFHYHSFNVSWHRPKVELSLSLNPGPIS